MPTPPVPRPPAPIAGPGAGRGAAPGAHGHRRRSTVALVLLLALLAVLGTGCVRVRTAAAVSTDDTVSGTVDIATPAGAPSGSGPPVAVPSNLSGDVSVRRYEQDGYVGSHVTFQDLSFDQFSRDLAALSPAVGRAVRVQLRRAGDKVVLSGDADLTRVTADGADVELKMAFPGPLEQTDGTVSRGVVSWTLPSGAVSQINATADYPDPNGPSWELWAVLLGLAALATAGLVFWLAKDGRDPTAPEQRTERGGDRRVRS